MAQFVLLALAVWCSGLPGSVPRLQLAMTWCRHSDRMGAPASLRSTCTYRQLQKYQRSMCRRHLHTAVQCTVLNQLAYLQVEIAGCHSRVECIPLQQLGVPKHAPRGATPTTFGRQHHVRPGAPPGRVEHHFVRPYRIAHALLVPNAWTGDAAAGC